VTVNESKTLATSRPRRRQAVVAFWIVGGLIAAIFLVPLGWAVYGSFQGPKGFTTGEYANVWNFGAGLPLYLTNTFIVAGVAVGVTLVVTVLGGYAMARLRFRGIRIVFIATLGILMVPYATLIIPLHVVLNWFGLLNSLVGVGLVLAMLQTPFGLFMMMNTFASLPGELEDSALVDGCTPFGTMWRIMLPLAVPGIVTVALFAFIAAWNDFFAPLLFLTSGNLYTLPVALQNLETGNFGAIDYGALQAGVIVSAIPCLILFLVLQRFYIRGFTSGAVKG
jgi:multiple sugar transport system permease protein